MYQILLLAIFLSTSAWSRAVAIKDNMLFAFEKCKALSVDLHKGQLKEAVTSSFDLHCRKVPAKPMDLNCAFFSSGGNEKTEEAIFSGGSELGEGELKDQKGRKIRFLIGKGFASFEDSGEHRLCAGIFLFEQEALKKKRE